MNAVELVKFLLNSSGFAALVTAGVAILAGRHLIDAKDQRITGLTETHAVTLKALQDAHIEALRAKDERIEMLERRSPAKLQEEVEAMTALLQSRSTQLQEELARTRADLEENRRLSAAERAVLEEKLAERERELSAVRDAVQVAEDVSVSLRTVTRQAEISREREIESLVIGALLRAMSPRYAELPNITLTASGGRRLMVDGVLQAVGSDPDLLVDIKYAVFSTNIRNQVTDAVSRLAHMCMVYEESQGRRSAGLLVFVLSTDSTRTDTSTFRAFERLRTTFQDLSATVRAPILLLDLTETALRQANISDLRLRLNTMLGVAVTAADDSS